MDDLLNIDNPFRRYGIVNKKFLSQLQLNKANISDTDVPFLFKFFSFLTVLLHIKFTKTELLQHAAKKLVHTKRVERRARRKSQ